MDKTNFAGLTRLAPGEPLGTDGYSFQNENPNIIDRYLEIGAVGHRHDGHAALADPTTLPTIAAVVGGGAILANTSIFATYTLLDADGGETLPATAQSVTTDAPLDPPDTGPTVALDTSAGGLLTNTYLYALTFTDGNGGETTLGPAAQIQRPPGPANAQVQITGLTAMLTAAGAVGWRLWRSVGGGRFGFVATGTGDTYTDDGSAALDCTMSPPTRNTTNGVNRVEVTVDNPQPADAVQFRIYLSTDASFDSPSLAGTYPIALIGVAQVYTVLDLSDGSPPDVSRSIPGANRLDAQTDLDNLFWRAPVANLAALPADGNAVGDARIALDTVTAYVVTDTATDPDTWTPLAGGGGGGGGGSWKDPVTFVSDLPPADNNAGDVRVVTFSGIAYAWLGGSWVDVWPDPFASGGAADPHWKAPVANQAALPGGDDDGEIRLSLAEGILWRWNGSAWKAIGGNHEAWVVPTLLNSWTDLNPGSSNVQVAFYRERQRVYCRGMVKLGSNGNEIFHLPAGYIPLADVRIAVPQMDFVGTAASTLCVVHVTNAGQVVTEDYTSPRVVALDGVSWALN